MTNSKDMTTRIGQDTDRVIDKLRPLEPMASLSPPRLAELASLSYIEKLGVGVCLFRVGDVDNQSIYLLQGDVQLTTAEGEERVITSGSDVARFSLDDKQPRQRTAVTLSQVEVLRVDNSVLDYMVTWDQLTVLDTSAAAADGQGAHRPDDAASLPPARADVPPAPSPGRETAGGAAPVQDPASAAVPEPALSTAPMVRVEPQRHLPDTSPGSGVLVAGETVQVPASSSPPRRDWAARMRHIMALKNLPPANVKALLAHMEKIRLRAGEVVVRQGEPGDYYYVLTEGKARVTHTVELAVLNAGATFGEEALISDALRNATVTMITDGTLMRLSKVDFNALMREPLIHRLSPDEARARIKQGAAWLDVRHANEYAHQHLSGAHNLPLHELRAHIGELDKTRHYICYCQTGRRSSAAAFLLSQRGFRASVLRGGLQVLPLKPRAD